MVEKFILLVILVGSLGRVNNANLEGRRAQCQEEGESVAVDHIDKLKCFSCICKNGFVECKNDFYCPPTNGCHMLVEKTKDGCCQKCKGCIYNGAHHSSHTEWTDPANPCKVLRCEAGVVTESDLQCYTPCANSLPPEPGKCCRTCPECKINGQVATEDRDVISDDPCLKCRCSKKHRMTCSKRACPVLQCNPSRQHHPPGECCPQCSGTRTLLTVPRSCTLQTSLFREGQKYSIDKCTNCTCLNETSICTRSACPILDCGPDLQKAVPGSCCKQCTAPEEVKTQCSYGGNMYEDGQAWQMDACRSCKCNNGLPSCAMTKCNVTLPCTPGTKLVHLQGECCEKCVAVDGVCMVFGDPHYKTFDGKIYTFEGSGKYQLVTDCQTQSFSIRVANESPNRTTKTSSSTRRVAIRYGGLRLNLQQKNRVKLKGKRIRLPYRKDDKIRIDKIHGNIQVHLHNGIKIFWNGKSFLEVSVPALYKNKLCGLCGNFNGNVQDDLRTKHQLVLKDHEVLQFANSWCVGSKAACAETYRSNKQMARLVACHGGHKPKKNWCKMLTDEELFGECETKLNPNKYYAACKIDMCSCPRGRCYCDSLMAYARECQRLGVELPDWRGLSRCGEEPPRGAKAPRPAAFAELDLGRIMRQRHFNKTRSPLLIQ